jgi:hypothetical protein
MTTTTHPTPPPRSLTITHRCTRCAWRGNLTEARTFALDGHACPRCRADIAPATDASPSATDAARGEFEDAIFTLLSAVCVGHIRWPENTRGHREAKHAIKQAREALLKSKWRVQTAELRTPAASVYQPMESEVQP